MGEISGDEIKWFWGFLMAEAMWQLKIEDGREAADGQLNPYPDRPGEPDCLHYLRTGICGFGSKCKYNHPALGVQVRAMGCNIFQ